jgi:two-component system, NarL family, response regulator DesR
MNGAGVLTVHPEDEIRRSARAVVNSTPGFEAVGEAVTAEEALELALALRPGLALVGTDMPGIDGFETSERLVAALPETTVVLLYASGKPGGDALTRARAAAALRLDELTPGTLQALWDDRGTR